ncbi:MAG: DUF2062 domain-containing protein [Planctomycetes bacterium]|nr:DUF2062 domain-containing protein [Planctomycetota bacterium]
MSGVRACAVIPVFDHGATVGRIADGASRHVELVIVVDDGSRDGGGDAARRASEIAARGGRRIEVLTLAENRGKGVALATGLRRAAELRFTHAVTLDADGQHRPYDIPALLAASAEDTGAIVVGARDLGAPEVPRGSHVGRWISNYWVLRTTGFDLPDTQSGFRVLPVAAVTALPLRCERYDYEVEILVRAAWAGCPLRSAPIDVVYPPRAERVSHLRPWSDNVRISWTYTRLALRRLLPDAAAWREARAQVRSTLRLRDAMRSVREMARQGTRPSELALAVAAGAFVGASPLWGLHGALTIYVCLRLHLNAIAGFVGSNVSLPFLAPYLVFASVQCGHALFHGAWLRADPATFGLADVPNALGWYLVGWLPVALTLAVVLGTATLVVASVVRRRP